MAACPLQNTEYVCVSGVKRKNEQWTAQDTEVIQFKTKEQAEKLETDPMFRVEYGGADVEKARGKAPSLLDLKVSGCLWGGVWGIGGEVD
jgi:hypothetical protein